MNKFDGIRTTEFNKEMLKKGWHLHQWDSDMEVITYKYYFMNLEERVDLTYQIIMDAKDQKELVDFLSRRVLNNFVNAIYEKLC